MPKNVLSAGQGCSYTKRESPGRRAHAAAKVVPVLHVQANADDEDAGRDTDPRNRD